MPTGNSSGISWNSARICATGSILRWPSWTGRPVNHPTSDNQTQLALGADGAKIAHGSNPHRGRFERGRRVKPSVGEIRKLVRFQRYDESGDRTGSCG